MAKYINLDKIRLSAHIESFVCEDMDLRNGCFVTLLGDEMVDGGEARVAIYGAHYDRGDVVLHASNGLVYDRPRETELDFYLAAGQAGRGYVVDEGNIVSYTIDGINGTPTIGAYVVPDNSEANAFDLRVTSTPPTDAGHVFGRIIDLNYNMFAGDLVVVRFNKVRGAGE